MIMSLALASSMLAGAASAKPILKTVATITQENRSFSHAEAGVQFELPRGWKAKPDGEVITVSTADDSLQLVFWVPDGDTFAAAWNVRDEENGKTCHNG